MTYLCAVGIQWTGTAPYLGERLLHRLSVVLSVFAAWPAPALPLSEHAQNSAPLQQRRKVFVYPLISTVIHIIQLTAVSISVSAAAFFMSYYHSEY